MYNSPKPLIIFTLVLFSFSLCKAQERAITENGDTIYIYSNGTWSYDLMVNVSSNDYDLSFLSEQMKVDTVKTKFKFSESAVKEINYPYGIFSIKYDNTEWTRVPAETLNEDASYAFQSKNNDLWAVVIAEETPIAKDKLFLIAKNTMKEATGLDPEIIKTEIRTVNGKEIFRGVMKADFTGLSFVFDTYYYSNDEGSVQFTTWTSERLWEKYNDKIQLLLNGFIAQ